MNVASRSCLSSALSGRRNTGSACGISCLVCTRIASLPFWLPSRDAYRGRLAPRTDFIEHARNIEQALDLLAKALRTSLGYTWTSFRHLVRAPPAATHGSSP